MATTAVYLDRSLSSVYLLWYLLKNTTEDVVAYQFNLPRRKLASRFAIAPSTADSTKIDSIAEILQTVRSFTYRKLDISSYDPKWTSIPDFELIHQASITSTNSKIDLPYTADTINHQHATLMKKAHTKVLSLEPVKPATLRYSLTDASKSHIDAVIELPSELLSLVDDSLEAISVSLRQKAISDGKTRDQIFNAELTIYSGTHSRYGVENDGNWFVDGDSLFGLVLGKKNTLIEHPYYAYLTK